MSGRMEFDYYYGIEAEQFSFYRVPRILIKDERFRGLSSDAKLLYGLMLDRMSLSMKNGWLDGQNRAYIYYTLENVMEDLGCCRDKCVKILAELDAKKGIGLIEKKRQGLGRPDIIYVKNFATVETEIKQNNADGRISGAEFPEQRGNVSRDNISGQPEKVSAAAVSSRVENACAAAVSSPEKEDTFPEQTGNATALETMGNDYVSDISGQPWDALLSEVSSRLGDISVPVIPGREEGTAGGSSRKSDVINFGRGPAKREEDFADKEVFAQLLACAEAARTSSETDGADMEKQTCRSRKNRLPEVGKTDLQKSEKQTSGNRENRLLGNEAGSGHEAGSGDGRSLENRPAEVGKTDLQKSEKQTSGNRENRLPEVRKTDLQKSEKQICGSRKNGLAEVGKTDTNYTEDSNTEQNNTDASDTENSNTEWRHTDANHMELNKKEVNDTSFCDINPINQSYPSGASSIHPSCRRLEQDPRQETGKTDRMEKAESYMELIKQNIEYDHFMQYGNPGDRKLFDNLYGVICSVVCADCEMVKVSGASYPHGMVKSRFLKLNRMHIEYVMHCLGQNTGRVYNINEYMKASLFNALNTIDSYYQQEVRHDMYGGGWAEKGII